jgi:hypothetical protein
VKVIPRMAPRSLEPRERAERAQRVRAWIRRSELPERIEDWPAGVRDHFEERAGIMEHHGCLPRIEAERRAEASVRAWWSRPPWTGPEDELTDADTADAELSQPLRPR